MENYKVVSSRYYIYKYIIYIFFSFLINTDIKINGNLIILSIEKIFLINYL